MRKRVILYALFLTLPLPAQSDSSTAAERSKDAWAALKKYFGEVPGYPDVYARNLAGPADKALPNAVWGEGQVANAALSVARLTGDYSDLARIAGTLPRYLVTNLGTTGYAPPIDGSKASPPPVRWWDDNGITALMLLDANEQLPSGGYLDAVKNLWTFIKSGQWPAGGQRDNEEAPGGAVATVATGMDDQMAERLYLLTDASDPNHADYLNLALKNDAYLKATLRSPEGLYWDGYFPDIQAAAFKWCDGTVTGGVCSGTWWACDPNRSDLPTQAQFPPSPNICGWRFVDKQGYMVGSDLLLYEISCRTHCDDTYLNSAIKTANAALDTYTLDWLVKESPWQNALYFVNLFALDRYAPNPRIRTAIEAYLEVAWNQARDPNTGLFNLGGIAIYNAAAGYSSLDQSGFSILFALLALPLIDTGGVVIHAGTSGIVSPGSLADIYGTNLAATAINAPAGTGWPTNLGGVQVLVNGKSAPLIYAGPSQIVFQMPYETALGTASVVVVNNNAPSATAPVAVQQAAPFLLTYGNNRAVVVNQDGSVNASGNGDKPGDVLVAYLIGSGPLDNPIATGAESPSSPLSREKLITTVTVGGANAAVQFAGMAPGFAGLMQINFVMPNLAPGDYSMQVKIGGAASNQPLLTVSR